MKRLAAALYVAMFAASLSTVHTVQAAQAADLDHADPDRAWILAAAHKQDPVDGGFVVLDMVKDGNAAYLCAAVRDKQGRLNRTDESVELHLLALRRQTDGWKANAITGTFTIDPPNPSDCFVEGHVIKTRADIDAFAKLVNRP